MALNKLKVSIHAPARGATERVAAVEDSALVSIHAPARGATYESAAYAERLKFQFTRPRGARRRLVVHDARRVGFNSRAREGRDFMSAASRFG